MARLQAETRRQAIIEASLPLFATHGFHGTSTKDIAREAGVSEALLYKHFASKDELYTALHDVCCARGVAAARELVDLPPSTASFVLCVSFLVRMVAVGSGENPKRHDLLTRLVAMSLLEDGAFARDFLAARIEPYMEQLVESWQAAVAVGDVVESSQSSLSPRTGLWLTHHLSFTLALAMRQASPLVSYVADKKAEGRETLIAAATLFALRGLGLASEAIDRHYQPRKMAKTVEALFLKSKKDS